MGKILLSGFKLEPSERVIADNIIRNYKTKFERMQFKYLKLDLKQRPHSKGGKITLYELNGILETNKKFASKSTGTNLFLIMVEVLDRLQHEAEHKFRTIRQRR